MYSLPKWRNLSNISLLLNLQKNFQKNLRKKLRQLCIPVDGSMKIFPVVKSVTIFCRTTLSTNWFAFKLNWLALVPVNDCTFTGTFRFLVEILKFIIVTSMTLFAMHLYLLGCTSTLTNFDSTNWSYLIWGGSFA